MPIATRTFRVFVSSTFEDLKEERDALQRDVFPKLRTLCEQHGARFQAIDLRWGVRDEAGLDQQTMEICRREIERCKRTGIKPNFIVLLGDRYGWQPLPPRIPASEFEAVRPHLPSGDTLMQADYWYKQDENAIPPEYCLQPRTGEFVDPAVWKRVEDTFYPALAQAARAAGLPENALIRYEASATHQEVLAGLGETETDRQHVFGFFRRPTAGQTDARLERLKTYLRARLPGNVEEFDPGDTAKLCADALTRLQQVIEQEVKRFEDRPALDLEVESHNRFAEERCRIFTGRESVLDTIAEYLRADDRRPLVLHGESGSGKSAVMAKASKQYQGPGRMIRRFIGASPQSASGHALLTSLCLEMEPGDTPVDYAQLENAFKERLKMASAEQPLVLFIDALDQLSASDPAREATWLPPALPLHVKVIVSTTDNGKRLLEALLVQLERMGQPEGAEALDELLREARRTLQPWQRETVLTHFERCGLPLYLKLAAEESRLWKSYTPVDDCALGEGIAGVIDTLFARLSTNANHGPVLLQRSLAYLAAARYGLAEDEILDVLTEDDAVWNDFNDRKYHEVSERRLPVVVWSRLSLDLEPYLTERAAPGGTVTTFFHRQLAECVASRFLAGTESQLRHTHLAQHFGLKPAWLDDARNVPNARRAVELPFQQRSAGQWSQAEETLFDVQFLFAKVAAGLVLDLDADYQTLFQVAEESSLSHSEALRLIQGALRLSFQVIDHDPLQFASQMIGRLLSDHSPRVQELIRSSADCCVAPWLKPKTASLTRPGGPLARVLTGHTDRVNAVVVTPDGKRAVSVSWDKTLKVWDLESGQELRTLTGHSRDVHGVAVTPDGKRAVSASDDKTVKVWDLESGHELQTLAGHSGRVTAVAVTPDGKCALSASWDQTVRMWNIETGQELQMLAGHSNGVDAVAVTPNGKRAVTGSRDKTLKVWDLESGQELQTLTGHSDAVHGVAVTADGKRAVSASEDKTLKVWDLENGREFRTLAGHGDGVMGVAVTADGKRAVSASVDENLKVWDIGSGKEMQTLAGHNNGVSAVAVTADGKRAVSTSWDHTLKVWDLAGRKESQAQAGHSDRVMGLAVIADGRRAVSASTDRSLKVWDLESGQELQTLAGHNGGINGVAVTLDGRRAVSASEDKTLKVWDLARGMALVELVGHYSAVNGVAVTPDGRRAVSASEDMTLNVWDLVEGRHLQTLWADINRDELAGMETRDGRRVLFFFSDDTRSRRNVSNRAPRRLTCHTMGVTAVALTPDGTRAVSASLDRTLKVWDLASGKVLKTLKGHSAMVTAVAVTADGRQAVSASADRTLNVWDLKSGKKLQKLAGHGNRVTSVALMPDGKRVVSVSRDQTLRVWDPETGKVVARFTAEAPLYSCAVGPDGRVIVAGDESGRVHFLSLEE